MASCQCCLRSPGRAACYPVQSAGHRPQLGLTSTWLHPTRSVFFPPFLTHCCVRLAVDMINQSIKPTWMHWRFGMWRLGILRNLRDGIPLLLWWCRRKGCPNQPCTSYWLLGFRPKGAPPFRAHSGHGTLLTMLLKLCHVWVCFCHV